MKRLPTLDQLEETAADVSRQLGTLSPRDLEKVHASIEVAIWEWEQKAINALGNADQSAYYKGARDALLSFHDDVALVRAAVTQKPE